jgi:hypothetical protein
MTRQKFTTEDLVFDDRTAAAIAAVLVGITFILMIVGWMSKRGVSDV